MKSPRDASMVLAAVATAAGVVAIASLTSGVAFSSLTRGSAEVLVVDASAEPELPTEVGDIVQEAQSDALASGQSAYELDAGEQVLVEAERALPDVVVDEVKSELARVPLDADDVQALADEVADRTGKYVVLVFEETDPATGQQTWTHTRARGMEPFRGVGSAEVVDHLDAWIATQQAPETYEVIVHD